MNTEYTRVIPRDLFNEAKALKCFGHLVLLIHDGPSLGITVEHSGDAFAIGLGDDGYLSIANLEFSLHGEVLIFKTIYNSKEAYPFYLMHEGEDCLVFDERGDYTKEFLAICSQIK